jgi:hypothetical protein
LQGNYSKKPFYQKSEYEVHQVGPKNAGSQNFSFLAFKGEAVGVTQIPSYNGAWQTENFFLHKSCFLGIKSPKTWKSAINFFHFFRRKTNTSLIFHMWQVKIGWDSRTHGGKFENPWGFSHGMSLNWKFQNINSIPPNRFGFA